MWREAENTLVKDFGFADFKTALDFVNKVGVIAERLNHHPDVELGWGRVKLVLTTHSAGKVTNKDHQLAAEIDKL